MLQFKKLLECYKFLWCNKLLHFKKLLHCSCYSVVVCVNEASNDSVSSSKLSPDNLSFHTHAPWKENNEEGKRFDDKAALWWSKMKMVVRFKPSILIFKDDFQRTSESSQLSNLASIQKDINLSEANYVIFQTIMPQDLFIWLLQRILMLPFPLDLITTVG